MNFYGRMPMGSVVLSPYSPVLTHLQLMFIVVTRSNSGLFSSAGFIVSLVGKRESGGNEGKEGKRELKMKGRKEEGIKKDRRQDKKEF